MRRTLPFLLAVTLFLAALARDRFDLWVGATRLPPLSVPTSTEVRARDGSLLRAFTVAGGRWRMEPGAVDPAFLTMLVAYEDRRFYAHRGVDPVALIRAGVQALRNGRVVSGGSTLTMQVARLLEDSGTGRLTGKLRQIRVALALERRLTKDQILGLYLRLAPYGGNVEGVRAASLAWFGKEPRRLTPAEAALLVAIPQSPETRRPDRSPGHLGGVAAEARARVLARMERDGLLDADRVAAALSEPVPTARRGFPALAPLLSQRLHDEEPLATVIPTTIDPTLQRALETLAARSVARSGDRLSVAILVADHRTGEILASVGAAEWTSDARAGFVDMTRAVRSPGSTLKPFVYGLAFDDGLAHPETLIDDRPVAFGPYAPQNFDRRFRGTLPVREALQASLNVPVISLTDALGPARLLAAIRRTGAEPQLPDMAEPGLAVALGGVGLSLTDLVQGYAALARLGEPIRLSERPGRAAPLPGRLFGAVAAWQVGDILSGLAPPPGAPASRLAYKTGTSYGYRDAWALGFDGRYVAGVWMGRADGSPVPGAFGGEVAAPVLFETFGRIEPTLTPLPPPPPSTLILPNARLPQPLQRFRPRGAAFAGGPGGPEVAFPPDGAEVETAGALTLKVRDGTPPFTWLANGAPVSLAGRSRESAAAIPVKGAVRLSVIDAEGRSSAVTVTLK
ncbi:MAG: penicillin-binding protein 1C [Pseudomonadota bacterium]